MRYLLPEGRLLADFCRVGVRIGGCLSDSVGNQAGHDALLPLDQCR
jgi:hypothetical protein